VYVDVLDSAEGRRSEGERA